MATNVILPALGMAQDTGKIVRWLKAEGEQIKQGEPLVEIETDKATVEIEALASGVLAQVAAEEGEDVPVGQVIATILAPGETSPSHTTPPASPISAQTAPPAAPVAVQPLSSLPPWAVEREAVPPVTASTSLNGGGHTVVVAASPLAARVAAAHNLDLSLVQTDGRRVQKADVLEYLRQQQPTGTISPVSLLPASPKARRLAREQGLDLAAIQGSGPGGAVLTADVQAAVATPAEPEAGSNIWQPMIDSFSSVIGEKQPAGGLQRPLESVGQVPGEPEASSVAVSNIWRIMAERTTQSWTSTPHFYLARELHASQLIAWRQRLLVGGQSKITYTDLLVKIVAISLRKHARLNATWDQGKILLSSGIHIGLAVAVEEGLVVPVIHHADQLTLAQLAEQRVELVAKARANKLRLPDISGGTFTISNLGMYGIDAFNAIINQPQAAILAVGRIAERVVPVDGLPAVRPMLALTLSCDHRVVDGANGAKFLASVADFIEEPLGLLDAI